MSGQRRPMPRGQGYLPKGGVRAAQLHNEAAGFPPVPPVAPSIPEPETNDARTDARASGWPTGRRAERLLVVGTSVVTSGLTSGLVAWLGR